MVIEQGTARITELQVENNKGDGDMEDGQLTKRMLLGSYPMESMPPTKATDNGPHHDDLES